MPIAPYAKVTLDVCDDRGTPYEVDFEDVELINEDESAGKSDWSSFRREAAKDFLCAIIGSTTGDVNVESWTETSVKMADVLIAKLKEK